MFVPGLLPLTLALALSMPLPTRVEADPQSPEGESAVAPKASERSEAAHWPQWRGPLGTGEAPGAQPPLEWSETENIRWKTRLPGTGHSTPLVWGNRLFLTSAEPTGERLSPVKEIAEGAHDNTPVTRRQRLLAMAVSRASGEILWQQELRVLLPHQGHHDSGTFASPSPVMDGEHFFAFFGSGGLYCLDLDGNVFWKAQAGEMHVKHGHGEGASPALHGDTLIVVLDHEGQSRLIAYEKGTGEVRWQLDRDEPTSWSSPIIVEVEGRPQVIVAGTNKVRAHDLEDGSLIWQCGGLTNNVVATPVASDGMAFAGSSYGPQAMMAIRLEGARGDLDQSEHLAWFRRRSTPYVPSPLLLDGTLYFMNHYQGFLCCLDAATGKDHQRPLRLNGPNEIYASLAAADGRIYIVDRSGLTIVMSAKTSPEVLASNLLDESFSASPVLVEKELYLRGTNYLYCIAEESREDD